MRWGSHMCGSLPSCRVWWARFPHPPLAPPLKGGEQVRPSPLRGEGWEGVTHLGLAVLRPACEFFISIDEWNQLARSLLIRPVRISEFIGQHSLLDPDPTEDYRDQG